MNACVFVPPSKDVMDGWEKLGNPGWNWDIIKPYFQKVFNVPKLSPEAKKHLGISWSGDEAFIGPLKTSFPCQLEDPLASAWDRTFETIGYQMTEDTFSGFGVGSFPCLRLIRQLRSEVILQLRTTNRQHTEKTSTSEQAALLKSCFFKRYIQVWKLQVPNSSKTEPVL